jgi:hypothetical protein
MSKEKRGAKAAPLFGAAGFARVDVEVLGWAIGAGHMQDFAHTDHFKPLGDQDHLGVIPTRAGHPHLAVPDVLKN